jgi:hypothetical protein
MTIRIHADDQQVHDSLRAPLDELDAALKGAKRAARVAATPEKLERQREARALEGKRDEAWRTFDQASRDPGRRKDELLDEIGSRAHAEHADRAALHAALAAVMRRSSSEARPFAALPSPGPDGAAGRSAARTPWRSRKPPNSRSAN